MLAGLLPQITIINGRHDRVVPVANAEFSTSGSPPATASGLWYTEWPPVTSEHDQRAGLSGHPPLVFAARGA